ncbi:MAG: NUDIX domain-containing protein [Halodesulfurarchaeum sp.]
MQPVWGPLLPFFKGWISPTAICRVRVSPRLTSSSRGVIECCSSNDGTRAIAMGSTASLRGTSGPGNSPRTMIREAQEEVGIGLERSMLEPVHVIHRDAGSRIYLDVFFRATDWRGTVENREPEKCGDLSWFDRNALPENTVPYVEQAIEQASGPALSEFGW